MSISVHYPEHDNPKVLSVIDQELCGSSDFIGREGVHFLGMYTAPCIFDEGKSSGGERYALYVLNVDKGLKCDVGAHYGSEPDQYLSGSYRSASYRSSWLTHSERCIFASQPLLHAIIRAFEKGILKPE
jgi:hypothetical protein